MAKIAGQGAMLSAIPESAGAPRVTPSPTKSAYPLPRSTAPPPSCSPVSEALAELEQSLTEKGIRTKPVAVDYAAHSAQIEALKDELEEAFSPITPKRPRSP